MPHDLLQGRDRTQTSSLREANYEEKECRFTIDPPEGNHMAIPIALKRLDAIIDAGASLHFVGVGSPGGRPDCWIAVALPFDGDKAYVVVSSNDPSIRALHQTNAIISILDRYRDHPHIQAVSLPLRASMETPEDIYALGKAEILQQDVLRLDHGVAQSSCRLARQDRAAHPWNRSHSR